MMKFLRSFLFLITLSCYLISQASAQNIRQQWLDNPQPDIPPEVTDQDIVNVQTTGAKQIMAYLHSPKMEETLAKCKALEETRFANTAKAYREQANQQATNANKQQFLQTADAIDAAKNKMSPTTCFFRALRLGLLVLELPYYGSQRLVSADESPHVVHFHRIGKAFENNEFSDAFDEALKEELSINYDEWLEKSLFEKMKENAEKLGLGNAYESAYALKVQRYNGIVNSLATWFIGGSLE